MNYINSVAKGDSFEKQVYEIIKELLENDDFFVNSKLSKIFWKKSYPSSKKGRGIEVDVSIETYLPGSDTFSFLTIIECKNYNSNVPINDIRELSSILNEIGEHNTKGLLISNSSFQKGTIEYARSVKIGLGRLSFNKKLDWINFRKDRKKISLDLSKCEDKLYNSKLPDESFFAFYGKKGFDKLPNLLIDLEIIDRYQNKLKYIDVPFLTKKQIQKTLEQIPLDSLYIDGGLDIDLTCSTLKKLYGVEFILDKELDAGVLGKTSFNPLQIHINKSLKSNVHRWRFTLSHEVGHLILHEKILSQFFDEKIETNDTISWVKSESFSNDFRIELQANIFASILLLPQKQLIDIVGKYFITENINKGNVYLDNQPINRRIVFQLLAELQKHFTVSKEVAKYRLISLGLLKDNSDNSIRNIMRKRL